MATRASGYAPDPLGRYYTPAWAVGALLDGYPRLEFADTFGDPCAGAGHILAALEAMGMRDLAGSDIEPDPNPVWHGLQIARRDARDPSKLLPGKRLAVITNPPYGYQGRLAMEIIVTMIDLARPDGMVAMLLSAGFEGRASRDHLFGHPVAAARIVLTDRIRWENVEHKKAGPSQAHVWWVWDWRHQGPPPFVLRRSRADGERRLRAGGSEAAA